ncbi:hypothetical protein [Gorillibacterium sp. sgz5001074]|uniref:hypothetical protein n=1 Tax=Gorillibacterium sp. sgz5001074 TaxID=3446695 RepID=UPI003F67FFE8
MDDTLKQKIINNTFVDKVRNEMVIDELDYLALKETLDMLSIELKSYQVVDKELALVLYSMPQVIRNIFISFGTHDNGSGIKDRLETIWMELDELVVESLSESV